LLPGVGYRLVRVPLNFGQEGYMANESKAIQANALTDIVTFEVMAFWSNVVL